MTRTEDLTSRVDGARTLFQTELPFVSGSAHVYVDGIRVALGEDYTEESVGSTEDPVSSGIVMAIPVPLGSSLVVVYSLVADGVITASGT